MVQKFYAYQLVMMLIVVLCAQELDFKPGGDVNINLDVKVNGKQAIKESYPKKDAGKKNVVCYFTCI